MAIYNGNTHDAMAFFAPRRRIPRETEAQKSAPVAGVVSVAIRRTAVSGEVAPAAAPEHAALARRRPRGGPRQALFDIRRTSLRTIAGEQMQRRPRARQDLVAAAHADNGPS